MAPLGQLLLAGLPAEYQRLIIEGPLNEVLWTEWLDSVEARHRWAWYANILENVSVDKLDFFFRYYRYALNLNIIITISNAERVALLLNDPRTSFDHVNEVIEDIMWRSTATFGGDNTFHKMLDYYNANDYVNFKIATQELIQLDLPLSQELRVILRNFLTLIHHERTQPHLIR